MKSFLKVFVLGLLLIAGCLSNQSCNSPTGHPETKPGEKMGVTMVYRTFFVSSIGNDANTGTIDKPFRNLEKAWSKVTAGDTVYVLGKIQFDKMQNLFNKNGTAQANIVISGYKGEIPLIERGSGFNQTHSNELILFAGDYVRFYRLEIANFAQRKGEYAYPAFRANPANNCFFEQINYHHNMSAFSLKGNSSNNTFLNCDFSYNQDPFSASAYDGADGLDLHELTGKNNSVLGCRFFWNSDDGLDLWNNQGYVLVQDNWSFYNGYIPGTFNAAGNGTGIKLGSGPKSTINLRDVFNNIAFKNRSYGIIENSMPCVMTITNNTAYKNGEIAYWWSWPEGKATLNSNIAFESPQLHRMSEKDVMINNSWQDNRKVTAEDFMSLDESELLKPRNADGSLPGLTFLQVREGSDLEDLGARFSRRPGSDTILPPPIDTTPVFQFERYVWADGTMSPGNKPRKVLAGVCLFYKRYNGEIIIKLK